MIFAHNYLSQDKRKDANTMRHRLFFLFCLVFVSFGIIFAQTGKNNFSQKKITIGLIGKISTNPVFIAAHSGAKIAAKELGAKYNVDVVIDWETPKKENVYEQAVAIRRLMSSGASGIAIACSDAKYLTPVIDEAIDKGIPIMCFDSDAPQSKRFAYYGINDIEFGKMIMKQLAVEIKGKGTIAVLAGNTHALNQQRRLKGIQEELKKYPNITLPEGNIFHNIEIADPSVEMVRREQKSNPNIVGWAFQGSWVFQSKDPFSWKPGEVKIVAGHAVQQELDYVKSGYVQSLVGVNCFEIGYKSVEILLDKIVKNKTPNEPLIYCPLTPVTGKNINEWSLNWNKWLLKEAANR
jgi:ribose transport system substrate-binding protein